MKISVTRNIGFIFLAVYLILVGIAALSPSLMVPSIVMGIIALVAGICILLGI